VLLVNAFGPSNKPDDKFRDLYFKSQDDKLKMSEDFRKEQKASYDKQLLESTEREAKLIEKSKVNTIRYEKVPVIVNAIPHSELASAIESEYGQ
jgi:hypothetical protein